jgi:hypothetical protein
MPIFWMRPEPLILLAFLQRHSDPQIRNMRVENFCEFLPDYWRPRPSITLLTITSDGARFKGPVPDDLRRLSLPESLSGRERMPKLKNLLIAVAAAMLSTSAALTDTKADDRSYLPPQDLQAQAKESGVQAAPQAEPGLRNTHYGTPPRYTRRHYAQGHTRRHYFPGIFFSLFR